MNPLRSLLVWLLLVVLPCQGLAVAAMLPGSSPMAAPAGPSCERHPLRHRHDHAHARCAACAACCAGFAPAPAPVRAPLAGGPAHVAIPFRAGYMTSTDPALPDRPPRFSFAFA